MWRKHFSNQNLAVVLLCGVLLSPLIFAGAYAYKKQHWAKEKISEIEPRYARLLGLQSQATRIEEAATRFRTDLAGYTYASDLEVSQAGNDAQQRLRNIFSQAKLDVVSSQVLPPRNDRQFDRIPLSIRVEGDLVGLQSALAVMRTQSPLIFVDTLSIQTANRTDAPQRLICQLSLSVLRIRP
ncbi:MAG: hypothetical protein RIS44_3044 [Pseudomonadota bacterium]|jgi:general secretion pathway protein M